MQVRIVRSCFSKQNKVAMQNFFEVSPIYPTNSEKDGSMYKQKRITISPLEANFNVFYP